MMRKPYVRTKWTKSKCYCGKVFIQTNPNRKLCDLHSKLNKENNAKLQNKKKTYPWTGYTKSTWRKLDSINYSTLRRAEKKSELERNNQRKDYPAPTRPKTVPLRGVKALVR